MCPDFGLKCERLNGHLCGVGPNVLGMGTKPHLSMHLLGSNAVRVIPE